MVAEASAVFLLESAGGEESLVSAQVDGGCGSSVLEVRDLVVKGEDAVHRGSPGFLTCGQGATGPVLFESEDRAVTGSEVGGIHGLHLICGGGTAARGEGESGKDSSRGGHG